MSARQDMTTLGTLAAAGKLRLLYVLGTPRSNSTVVCRLLGERLDGAVYEPAMPNSGNPLGHFAKLLLTAYSAAREKAGADRPIVLAVKDLDGFLTPEMSDFILVASAHIVFTIRDPALQYPSLSRQFVEEFSPLFRIRSTLRHPIEQNWFLWHMLRWLPRFWGLTRDELGPGQNLLRAAAAGFNYASWLGQADHLESARIALAAERITILDASLSRLYPRETTGMLASIADACAAAPVQSESREFAGHSRMAANSHWANEARAGGDIKPLSLDAGRRFDDPAAAAFAAKVSASLYPQYLSAFFDPSHRQLAEARQRGLPPGAPASLRLLVEASDSAEAGRTFAF
ncbi:MAG: hypothetical protein WEB63_10065 [Cucumibacter sp.]